MKRDLYFANNTERNLSYYLTAGKLLIYDEPDKTLKKAAIFFKSMHGLFKDDPYIYIIIEKIKHSSILGEAYWYASFAIDEDGCCRFSIPTIHKFFDELKSLIEEYREAGYNFDGSDLVKSIFSYNEEKKGKEGEEE